MKTRVIETEEGFYAQIKGWIFWYRIAKHTYGYGLYNELSYPEKSLKDAEKLLDSYVKYETRSTFLQVRLEKEF